MAKAVAEFMGTFLLVFTVGCNVMGNSGTFAPVSIASVLMVCIYALGGISGANFNPAVSVTLGISKSMGGPGDMPWAMVAVYCGVQLLAGVSAGFAYAAMFGGPGFALGPAPGFGLATAGFCELMYTFMLRFVVMNVAVASKNKVEDGQYFGLAIGFVIVAGAYGAGAVSGGCFNPAVATGIDLASGKSGWTNLVAYVIAELAGAALAAVMFRVTRPEDFGFRKIPLSCYVSEFLGTYILVLTVGLNVLGKSPAGAYSIAAALMCMIYALGDVSGAHFNPAVTVAIFASGLDATLKPVEVAKYIGLQLLGGICGALSYSMVYSGKTIPLGPVGSHGWSEVAVAEVVFTFVLCFVVLAAACNEKTKTTKFFGLAIGSCVTVGGLAIGGISGGSLNPAVSLGIGGVHSFLNACVYSVFEVAGAALAAGVLKVTHGEMGKEATSLA